MVGYLFTLLESYERGRKKDKRRKKDHYFLTSLFSKNSDRRIKRDERIKEKKSEIQHHRYDRRVSKQLCYRLVKRFLSDLRAHCLILFSICFPTFFSFFFCLFNSLFNSELCQSTCFGNEKQTKQKKKDKIKKEENIY